MQAGAYAREYGAHSRAQTADTHNLSEQCQVLAAHDIQPGNVNICEQRSSAGGNRARGCRHHVPLPCTSKHERAEVVV